ncbi:MAG: hypothetical protein K2X38_18265 [Gemmataceae bacterium]|nr:hypothetical protein [Gemmataceae bacterium]
MFTMHTLGQWITAEPFRPFRIKMASGQTFEIRHPEMISVGRSSATLSFFLSDSVDEANQRSREISLMLIESVEPLDVPVRNEAK